MAQGAVENHQEIIDEIVQHIHQKLAPKKAANVESFARQYYRNVALDDLRTRGVDNLYGAMLSLWNFLQQRKPGQAKVHVFNPEYEQDGWQSTHTIVQIANDDMPFLVDSIAMELNRHQLTTHLMIHQGGMKMRRDRRGKMREVLPRDHDAIDNDIVLEAPVYAEVDRQTDPKILATLTENLERILDDVRIVVNDWRPMKKRVEEVLLELETLPGKVAPDDLAESEDFLRWVGNDHFTFLGCRDYEVAGAGKTAEIHAVPGSGLGLLQDERAIPTDSRKLSTLTAEGRAIALSKNPLILTKTNYRSTVHRSTYTDYIGVKRFNKQGKLIGERRFIGLYTSTVYHRSAQSIPFIRRKISAVLQKAGFLASGHAGKELLNILESLPRDELLQATTQELYDTAMGILQLQERKRIRLFIRKEPFGRYFSCLVFVPRERFNTELRERMQGILHECLGGEESEFSTLFSESVLARIHYVVRTKGGGLPKYDIDYIQSKLVEAARSWQDDLQGALLDHFGEEKGNVLVNRYSDAFPLGYRDQFLPQSAVYDIEHIEALAESAQPLVMNFYRAVDADEKTLQLKLFHLGEPIPLSDVLPILENMGLRVVADLPHEIRPAKGESVWIHDFMMTHSQGRVIEIAAVKAIFEEAFALLWAGHAENDGFNKLVLSAQMSCREVAVLRAYSKYLQQIGFNLSQQYIAETLHEQAHIATQLLALFQVRFDPARQKEGVKSADKLVAQIEGLLEDVKNLNQDRIVTQYLDLILATLRTNYYQPDSDGNQKGYFSFKINSQQVAELPLPRPLYEIFVYSPRVEGIHLRGAKVARGGLRWSDRGEDFRTEVLGLMKAQQVKNAVIVPAGAKGGFFVKHLPFGNRETMMEEVVFCYKTFIRGLLDITDNRVDGEVVPPAEVVCYDKDDPYLVVAADKGTATFSDIANGIAQEYDFWLGDAFASGGSAGYDHKKMGITARGAWVSVMRHFRERGLDTQTTDFTVLGIGDMAGDVFGNGMLQSKHIKLVAAFNHLHIFIDPSPDLKKSYAERERLFNLPRSSWEDYNKKLISKGGGIFSRSDKAIPLSSEMKKLLRTKQDKLVPDQLIHHLLKAKVDLIWNGGIGTYVKASEESHLDVGDKANDAVRVNGSELQCKVVGEGGNLGLTQLGRIEYALNGGAIYTDFIDNSAGVDCSDHEVNIKILLNDIVNNEDMTVKQRNTLLAKMTEEVGQLCLLNNYRQTQSIGISGYQAASNVNLHQRYIRALEQEDKLDRELEFLPSDKVINERKADEIGLTEAEISVLAAYSKNIVSEDLLASDLPEDPALLPLLSMAFPQPITAKFRDALANHQLKREIIVNQLVNQMNNLMSFTFVHRLHDETGANTESITRAFLIASQVFDMHTLWREIEALDNHVPAKVQMDMMLDIIRLIRRATRWFLRNRPVGVDIDETVSQFAPQVAELRQGLGDFLMGSQKEAWQSLTNHYVTAHVPKALAVQVAAVIPLVSALDIIDKSTTDSVPLTDMATVYFAMAERLELNWLREQITQYPVRDHWDAWARAVLRDDLDRQQRELAIAVLSLPHTEATVTAGIETWFTENEEQVARWDAMVKELRTAPTYEFSMFSVALRELMYMAQFSLCAIDPDSRVCV